MAPFWEVGILDGSGSSSQAGEACIGAQSVREQCTALRSARTRIGRAVGIGARSQHRQGSSTDEDNAHCCVLKIG